MNQLLAAFILIGFVVAAQFLNITTPVTITMLVVLTLIFLSYIISEHVSAINSLKATIEMRLKVVENSIAALNDSLPPDEIDRIKGAASKIAMQSIGR